MQDESRIRPVLLPVFVLFLSGLTALGFLSVVWRRRQMPPLLRGLLIIVATAVVVFVAWSFVSTLRH